MPANPYIPNKDADLALWSANFSALLTATPADFGLVAGDATAVAAVDTAFQAAFLVASNPATRTSPTIAAKDDAKAALLFTVRPYAQRIANDQSVSNENKLAIGVNLPNNTRTPIPAPTTAADLGLLAVNPQIADLRFRDITTPTKKAKPFGATGADVVMTIGAAPTSDPDAATYYGTFAKTPFSLAFRAEDAGKVASVWARWTTRSGPAGVAQKGPWSTRLVFSIV